MLTALHSSQLPWGAQPPVQHQPPLHPPPLPKDTAMSCPGWSQGQPRRGWGTQGCVGAAALVIPCPITLQMVVLWGSKHVYGTVGQHEHLVCVCVSVREQGSSCVSRGGCPGARGVWGTVQVWGWLRCTCGPWGAAQGARLCLWTQL